MRLRLTTTRLLVLTLFAGVLAQSLVPTGYMPAAAGDGFVQLCPRGLTDHQMSVLHGAHAEHHAPQETSDVDETPWCPLGGAVNDSVSVVSNLVPGTWLAHDSPVIHPAKRRISRIEWAPFRSRAPPRV